MAPILGSRPAGLSRNKRPIDGQFAAPGARCRAYSARVKKRSASVRTLAAWLLAWCAGAFVPALAQADGAALGDTLAQQVRELTLTASHTAVGTRVEVEVGRLDPRLRLAPCQQVEPYLPPGVRPWGKSRVGLRCVQGATRWNVYLPVTVRVYATALVAAQPLAAGTVLGVADLQTAEVDLAAERAPAIARAELAVGRTLARPLAAGAALRSTDLRVRQWFAAGDTVRIVAAGNGYAVSAEGVAMSHGNEGQTVRVRTDGGRVITGLPAGERRVEVMF